MNRLGLLPMLYLFFGVLVSFTGCQKPTAQDKATAKTEERMVDKTAPNRPAPLRGQVSDDFLYAKCVERDSFVYGTLDSGRKIVSDGAFLEVRDEISPALYALRTKVKRSWQISHEQAMDSLPRPSEYRRSECIVARIVVDETNSDLRNLTSRNGHTCSIAADYLDYITTTFPQALIYVSSPKAAVMVEDSGKLVAAVMSIAKGE